MNFFELSIKLPVDTSIVRVNSTQNRRQGSSKGSGLPLRCTSGKSGAREARRRRTVEEYSRLFVFESSAGSRELASGICRYCGFYPVVEWHREEYLAIESDALKHRSRTKAGTSCILDVQLKRFRGNERKGERRSRDWLGKY